MTIFLILGLFGYRLTDATPNLLQVNLVYRHGDRSPIQTFPKDVYQEEFWPRGFGQLSKKNIL